jgi:hypothetical protein
MTEYFRHTVLRFFTERKLLSEHFARNMLSWRHSGFSPDAWPSSERSERPGIDNCVRILDESSRNVHMFEACDFPAELTPGSMGEQ